MAARIAFQGEPGSYSHQACADARPDYDPLPCPTFEDAMEAVRSGAADLGMMFYTGKQFPSKYKNGIFSAQHGSWNRRPVSGYKVIFVPFADGKPSGKAEDVLTGFLNNKDQAQGRPVGVVVDAKGALLIADDVGNTIWRVTPAGN